MRFGEKKKSEKKGKGEKEKKREKREKREERTARGKAIHALSREVASVLRRSEQLFEQGLEAEKLGDAGTAESFLTRAVGEVLSADGRLYAIRSHAFVLNGRAPNKSEEQPTSTSFPYG